MPTSNVEIPNLTQLRLEVIKRLRKNPLEEWTSREINVASYLLGSAAGRRLAILRLGPPQYQFNEEPLIVAAARDLDDPEFKLPKWVTLVMWLAPEGLANTAPVQVGLIAKYALGYDVEKIEADIPDDALNYEP